MKSVSFRYQTELHFSSPAAKHRFLLKILPPADNRQQIKQLSWQIEPTATVWKTLDGFGNDALSGYIDAAHEYFRFGIEGSAQVSGEPYTERGQHTGALLYHTELTNPGAAIINFYNDAKQSAPSGILSRIEHFSQAVNKCLRYEHGATTNATAAQEAFDCGAGVCQDYAHILLTLLRLDKIPCSYVAGLASDYGETHAWVEAQISKGRFCGIDPTRNKLIDENYIALSRGRDFKDCSVERGVFKGACRGTQIVNLKMEVAQ
ncbi:MAG: transglutaminase family protein [Chitinispirillales bacterium]|jgi:transglutaminase-like putative cysteine protease|nr:transglutaminase family protein [Chitinispirillales bacterium]